MTKQIDFNRYEHFVDAVTSDASKDFLSLSDRLVELDQKGANIERLMTASVGMSAEAGEFTEIVKKMVFQGKPYSEDNREHLIIELGDIVYYKFNILFIIYHLMHDSLIGIHQTHQMDISSLIF